MYTRIYQDDLKEILDTMELPNGEKLTVVLERISTSCYFCDEWNHIKKIFPKLVQEDATTKAQGREAGTPVKDTDGDLMEVSRRKREKTYITEGRRAVQKTQDTNRNILRKK